MRVASCAVAGVCRDRGGILGPWHRRLLGDLRHPQRRRAQAIPVAEPGRLFSLSEIDRRTGVAGSELSYPDFRDLRDARSFEGIAAADPLLPLSIGGQGDPQRHWGALVTANYFAVVKPASRSAGFDPGRDDTPGEPPVVVLSHTLWNRRFGGDPGIVGRRSRSTNEPLRSLV